jgi:hypothetical protein
MRQSEGKADFESEKEAITKVPDFPSGRKMRKDKDAALHLG